MKTIARLAATTTLVLASAAHAQELRELCADRPGLGTPPCVVDRGHVVAELGLADWAREDDGVQRTDTIVSGDLLVRVGLTDTIEGQVGWTAFGHRRERAASTRAVMRSSGIGTCSSHCGRMFAIRRRRHVADGNAYATLPTGGGQSGWAIGALACGCR